MYIIDTPSEYIVSLAKEKKEDYFGGFKYHSI